MVTFSLCMIVKNEEKVLRKCLNCIKEIVDEIIILDTGSTDNTKIIALEYTSKVYNFSWCNDFAKARNKSFEYATKDFILWLDADDMITDYNIEKLKTLKSTLTDSIDSVNMIYSLNRNAKNETMYSLRRNRLIKREGNFKWIGKVHEYINVEGNLLYSDIEIWHEKEDFSNKNRNLNIYKLMQDNNEIFSTRDIFYFANELYDNQVYDEAITQYELFLKKTDSWLEDKKTASFNLAQCYINKLNNIKALSTLINTFQYDAPRADICCCIAYLFLCNNQISQATFWYKTALNCKPNKNTLGFNNKIYYTVIPAIQLCVCYTQLNDFITAYYYNEIASKYSLYSEKIHHNRAFIQNKFLELNIPVPNLLELLNIDIN